MAPRTVIAVRAFVAIDDARYTVVAEGERLPATAPVVRAHPKMFQSDARPKASRSGSEEAVDEFTPDDIERGLLAYTADRLDPEARLPALITAAIRTAEDPERVGSMLRRGASVRVYPDADGSARLVLEFGEEAEVLAAVRAAVWGADAESAPPPGSDERGEVLTLRSLPVSALAALPTG